MKINEIPNGQECNITSGFVTELATGNTIFDITFDCTATGEYQFDNLGIARRKFINCNPLIFGKSEIWLSWKDFEKKPEFSLTTEKELENTNV